MDTQPTEQLLHKVPGAAKRLALSERSIWSLIAAGDIAVVRVGRSVRISERALQDFIERNTDEVRR
jgi:excisionase family DNA binding protein